MNADIRVLDDPAQEAAQLLAAASGQLALTGVRELSLITTPPVDRLAVRTYISPFDPMIIRDALRRERYRGGQSFYGHYFKCHKKDGHGSIDLRHAIEQSCDVFFYTVGNMLGVDRINKWATLFGLGVKSVIFVVVHSVLWPMALNTYTGFVAVPQTLRRVGQNFGLTGWRLVAGILLPAAFPYLLSGIKIGWAFAWRTIIAAEMVFGVAGSQGGLGWFIYQNRFEMNTDLVFAGLLTVKDQGALELAWLAAAVIGLAPGGRFFLHYYLAVLPPLCLAADALRIHRPALAATGIAVAALWLWNIGFNPTFHQLLLR